MSQTGNREDKRRTPSTLNGTWTNVLENSSLYSPQQHDHSKVQLENAQEVAPFPLGQRWMSADLIQISVVTDYSIFLCSVLHPLTRITVSLCLWERPPPYLYSIFCKSFPSFTTPPHPTPIKQSEPVTSLQKMTAPTSLRPLHSMEFNFLYSHFFLSHSLCFSHQQIILLGASLVLSSVLFHNLPHTAGQTHSFMLRNTYTHTHTFKCWLTGSRCF